MCETMILSMHRIKNDIMLKLNSELYKKLFSSNINKSQTIIVELAKKYNQANEHNQESNLNSESEEIVIEDKDFKGKFPNELHLFSNKFHIFSYKIWFTRNLFYDSIQISYLKLWINNIWHLLIQLI